MQNILRTLALATLAVTATAAYAADTATVNVPFNFESQGQVYPAGNYDVSLMMNHEMLAVHSKTDTRKAMMLAVAPADFRDGAPIVRIKFDALNGGYSLRTIQYGARITPVLDAGVKHGKTIELPFARPR